ncbi:MAG: peptidoglycan-binding protein [Candidatus Phaeomarinobacter sp.]
MPLTLLQKRAAQAIINIFETGTPGGDYAMVTLLPGDSGHLTYGRAQTTLGSGNLHLLVKSYCEAQGAALAGQLVPFLDPLQNIDLSLDHDFEFRSLLAQAGTDPVMQEVQDAFFDRLYWTPAEVAARNLGLGDPLAMAVVYDGKVHGSWVRIRDRVNDRHGHPGIIGQRGWIHRYVGERRSWLAGHSNRLLRRTVYRMDAFSALMDAGNWPLSLPFSVRGQHISADVLGASPVRVTAEDTTQRTLKLTNPPMSGNDVEALQKALAERGWAINIDAVYDEGTRRCVSQFQDEAGLVADGIAGPATLSALDLA